MATDLKIDFGTVKQGSQPTLSFTWPLSSLHTSPSNLTGFTVTGTAKSHETGEVTSLSGTFTVIAALTVTWEMSALDTGTAGSFYIDLNATDGTDNIYTLSGSLAVEVNPSVNAVQNPALVGISTAKDSWLTTSAAGGALGELAYIDDADSDGTQYARKNGAWEAVAGSGGDVDDLTTTTGNSTEMVRVAAAGGLEYRTPAQVLGDIGAEASGAAATVAGNLTTHIGLTGTSVHGLGTMATETASNYAALAGATFTGGVTLSPTSGPALTINPASGGVGIQIASTNNFTISATGTGTALTTLSGLTATNTIVRGIYVRGTSSGTTAAGFGIGINLALKSSTTGDTDAGRFVVLWNDATHATRKADMVLYITDYGGEREGLRIRGNGTEPAIGFYGVTPTARQLLATGAGATVDNVITALQNLGLLKQS